MSSRAEATKSARRESSTVPYTNRHADYPPVNDDEPALVNDVSTVVAKEDVVVSDPRSSSADVAEEMADIRWRLPPRR